MDDDDADSGAGERGLVLAGCNGALFPVAPAGPTTRQGSRTIDEASLFSVDQVLRFVRYRGGRAATVRQRAVDTHGGVWVDGDAHIGSKHVVTLILNYGPAEAAVDLLANSVRAVRLGPVAVDPPDTRTALVDLQEKTSRLESIDRLTWRLFAPDGDPEKYERGISLFISRCPGLLEKILADDQSSVVRDHLTEKLLIEHRPALTLMNGLLAQFLKRHQYLFTKRLTDQVLLRISTSGVQMPSPFALGVDSAQKAAFDVLPDLPEVKVHAVHDGAVAVRVGIANLLRFMLSVPGLRELLQESGFQGIAVKVCADAADLVNSRNVTALSIMIILPRLGNTTRYVSCETLYMGGDHATEQKAFLRFGAYAEIKKIADEGLDGVPYLRLGDRAPLHVEFVFSFDGSARRVAGGFVAAKGKYPIPGVPVQTQELGDALVRPADINQIKPGARLAADSGEQLTSTETLGLKGADLAGVDLPTLKIETLHGTMLIAKHMGVALYAVFVAFGLSDKYQAIMTKYGVTFFINKTADGRSETLTICNGVHVAKLYVQGLWDDLAAALRDAGHAEESACVRYTGTMACKLSAVVLNHETTASYWLDVNLLALAMGLALRFSFYGGVITPGVFEMIKVLPAQIRLIRQLEVSLGLPITCDTLSVNDVHFNGAFEYINYMLSQILRLSARGGGRSKKAVEALGVALAAAKSRHGGTVGSQFNNLERALRQQHIRQALALVLVTDDVFQKRALARRLKREATRYGDLPKASQFGSPASIAAPLAYLLDATGDATAPPVPTPALPVEATGPRSEDDAPVAKRPRQDDAPAPGAAPVPGELAEPRGAALSDDNDGSDSDDDAAEASDDDGGDGAPRDPLDSDDEDVDPYKDAALEDDVAPITVESALAQLEAAGPTTQLQSGKLGSEFHAGETELTLDRSFDSAVVVAPTTIRIKIRLDGDPLGTQIVLPHSRVAVVYYDAAGNELAFLLHKMPSFWRQYQMSAKKIAGATAPTTTHKFAFAKTPTADPSPGDVLSNNKLLRVTCVTDGGFDAAVKHLESIKDHPVVRRQAAPEAHRTLKLTPAAPAADDDMEDGADASDLGPQRGVANLRAFPTETLGALKELDRVFHDFASRRPLEVPDVFAPTLPDDFLKSYLHALAPIQSRFFATLEKTAPRVYGLNELDA